MEKELNFLHEKGYPINGFEHAFTKMIVSRESADEYWLTMEFEINKYLPADSFILAIGAQQELKIPDAEMVRMYGNRPEFADLYEDPTLIGETDPVRNRYTGGLEIEIPLTVNTPVYEMTAEDGGTVFLSGFELFTEKWQPFCDDWNTERAFTLHKQDGSTSEMHYLSVQAQAGNFGAVQGKKYKAEAQIFETIAGRRFQRDDPTSFNGFADITGVTSMELAGVTYSRTEC